MAAHQDLEGPGADGAQTPGEVRDDTDVVHLVQNDIHRHWAPLFRRTVSVADQLDEQEGEKKGRQKFQRGVLVIQDDVIYAFGLPGKSEVDVGLAGDTSDSLALEHLQSGTQAQDHTGPHGIAGLAEQAVGCPGRVVQGQPVKEGGELLFRVLGQHLVDCGQVALLRAAGGVQIHIEDQAFQQVGLSVIPEMVPLAVPLRIGNDNICQDLGH